MIKDSKPEENNAVAQNSQPGGQIKIRWDDKNMRSVYANVANVAGTREEIVILFGMNQSFNSAEREMGVQLSDRIVLSPYVAKRLSLLLNNVVKNYESRWGKLDIEQAAQAQ